MEACPKPVLQALKAQQVHAIHTSSVQTHHKLARCRLKHEEVFIDDGFIRCPLLCLEFSVQDRQYDGVSVQGAELEYRILHD